MIKRLPSWAAVRATFIEKSKRIRVQMVFWTLVMLLISIGVLLELRTSYDAQLYQTDLIDRSTAVINDIAASLGVIEVLDEQDVDNEILTKEVQAPALEEITVYEVIPGIDPRMIASTVNSPAVTLDQILPLTPAAKYMEGSRGERLMVIGRQVPNHPGYYIVAATTLEYVDQADSINRRTALVFTLGSIIIALLLLNYIFQQKIGKPLDAILAVVARAHLGDYTDRVQNVRQDEMGEVARSFNEMLDRVEVRTEEKNRLIAEARQGMLETQNRLIQAERLATAGQMAATFAHEIGSPLASLSAHAELLMEDPDTTPHQRESASIIHRQITRVTQIVDELLRSARRGPEDFVMVNVPEALGEVLKLVLPRLDAQRIRVINRVPDGLYIRGYALYLQEVFLNLINNAAEAIDRDGTIEISGATENGKVWIELKDSGPGIDPKVIDDMWKQFVTTKAMRKGTGLGLAVVRDIVKQHGGEVSLQSSDHGTLVRVTLPAYKHSMVSV